MNYSLGNMLNGGESLNADRLSLDLQFATDKTLTARKGPTPVFTRASTATFVGSNGLIQSAAINDARFDHDPVTLASKGLLIEESRTNLVFPSATLTTQTRTVTATAHTLSFYGTGTVVLSGAHVATVTGTGAFPTRTTLTFTPTAGSLTLTVTGSVTEAQLEVGDFPTSYIPTTTASVVRSVDVCSITGSAFTGMYNQSEGTLVASVLFPTLSVVNLHGWTISDNTSNNRFYFRASGTNNVAADMITSGSFQLTGFSFNASGSPITKSALAIVNNNCAFSVNGGVPITDAIVTLPVVTELEIGATFNNAQQINGHIASIRYYKKRLANAKLQTLTT